MRSTTILVAAAITAAVLFSTPSVHAGEEVAGSEAPIQAADHLGLLRHVLVIGIDDYDDRGIPDLANSENGARGVFSVLVDPLTGGIPPANAQSLLGAEATAANIRAALERLQHVRKEATVFVYFAGHGATQGENAYWVTQDSKEDDLSATAVAATDVRQLLGQIPAARVLLMMECRHAVGLVGAGKARVDHAGILTRYHGMTYATLGAAGTEEHSIASEEVERPVFTHYLVEGLSGTAEGDGDGIVDLSELATYTSDHVRAEARKRRGLERPVADLGGVPDPSRFFLTIEQEGLAECLLEDAPAQTRRHDRLAALAALHSEGRIAAEQERVGRYLLGASVDGFETHELEQRTMFVDLAEGRLDPKHLTGALAAIRRADRRTLVVPDEFKTIQAAIDAASAGDTVSVKEGRYDEHIVFKSGLRLQGEGRERTVIRVVPGQPEILLAEDCAWGAIESLQFDGTGGTAIGDWSPDGVHLKSSSVRVLDCTSHSCLGGGMYATGTGSRPYVEACTFEQNGQDGVCFTGTDGGEIVECIARSNGAVGIQVRTSRGAVAVRDCLCEFDKQAGIGVCGGSTATLRGNDCQSNGGHGILVWDRKTSVSLEDNSCTRNAIYGIYVVQGAAAAANGSVCRRNKESGIAVSGTGTRATVVGSSCLENNLSNQGFKCGIVFTDGAGGSARSNTCDGNACGILVRGPGTFGQLRDNTCRKNATSGIEFADAATGHATGNQCDENEHGIRVSRAEATLQDNTLRRNTKHGITIGTRGTGTASENRCEENQQAGIHVTDRGTRAELLKNTCASNGSHGIQFARGASGKADGNECSGNKAFGICAFDSGTQPTFRRNRCTNNGRAGIGKQDGAAPIIESNNVQSGNGR